MVTLLLELEGAAAGWEKVNMGELEEVLLLPVDSGLFCAETEGAAAGWEKLKPTRLDLSPDNREKPVVEVPVVGAILPEFAWVAALPKGELDIEVVCRLGASGLALKMGLNNTSLAGLKLNSDDPKPLLWVIFAAAPNAPVVTDVDERGPN